MRHNPLLFVRLSLFRKRLRKNVLLRRYFSKKIKLLKFFYTNRCNYPKIFKKINMGFAPSMHYTAYQSRLQWPKRKIFSIRYCGLVEIIRKANIAIRYIFQENYTKIKKKMYTHILDFLYIYNLFFLNISLTIFYFLKRIKKDKAKNIFKLILTFINRKMFLNLQHNFTKKNYLFLAPGFFVKFFDKKKSIKKNKNTKLLMAKYLRKIYLFVKVKYQIILIKKNPVFFLEFLSFLNSPIIHKFTNPFTDKIIEEKVNFNPIVKTLYFVFFKSQDFSFTKTKKKGRIKRKISRKLILQNKIVD